MFCSLRYIPENSKLRNIIHTERYRQRKCVPSCPLLTRNWASGSLKSWKKLLSLSLPIHDIVTAAASHFSIFFVGSWQSRHRVWVTLPSYSVNHRLGWYWCDLAGLRGANPYDAATWGCAGNTAAGCICAGRGWEACVASTGRALAWCAGGGNALLKHMQQNLLEKCGS